MKHIIKISLMLLVYSCSSENVPVKTEEAEATKEIVIEGTQEIETAEKVVDGLLLAIKNEEFENIPNYYADIFYENITKEQWNEDLKKMKSILGELRKAHLVGTQIETHIKGELIVLLYDIEYSLHTSEEKFTLIKDGPTYKIAGHNIKSDAL